MQFGRQETRGQRPRELIRKETTLKIQKKTIYDGLALIVSVDAESGSSDLCELCNEGSVKRCRRDLKNPHEEADLIATVYRRFDYELVQLKNPSLAELEEAWRTCEETLTYNNDGSSEGSENSSSKAKRKTFFFAFVGHG